MSLAWTPELHREMVGIYYNNIRYVDMLQPNIRYTWNTITKSLCDLHFTKHDDNDLAVKTVNDIILRYHFITIPEGIARLVHFLIQNSDDFKTKEASSSQIYKHMKDKMTLAWSREMHENLQNVYYGDNTDREMSAFTIYAWSKITSEICDISLYKIDSLKTAYNEINSIMNCYFVDIIKPEGVLRIAQFMVKHSPSKSNHLTLKPAPSGTYVIEKGALTNRTFEEQEKHKSFDFSDLASHSAIGLTTWKRR